MKLREALAEKEAMIEGIKPIDKSAFDLAFNYAVNHNRNTGISILDIIPIFIQGHSLSRKQVIEEVEEWVNDNWKYESMIIYPKIELLTKLKTLTP